jgi:hypothetical protein
MCRESAHDAAMLLSTNLEGPCHLLAVEYPFAHLLLHLLIGQGVLHIGGGVDVRVPPVRDQLQLDVGIFAAEVAAARLAEVRQTWPFVPRALDERSRDVGLALPRLRPMPSTPERLLPSSYVHI